jgi:hypothetical protein
MGVHVYHKRRKESGRGLVVSLLTPHKAWHVKQCKNRSATPEQRKLCCVLNVCLSRVCRFTFFARVALVAYLPFACVYYYNDPAPSRPPSPFFSFSAPPRALLFMTRKEQNVKLSLSARAQGKDISISSPFYRYPVSPFPVQHPPTHMHTGLPPSAERHYLSVTTVSDARPSSCSLQSPPTRKGHYTKFRYCYLSPSLWCPLLPPNAPLFPPHYNQAHIVVQDRRQPPR